MIRLAKQESYILMQKMVVPKNMVMLDYCKFQTSSTDICRQKAASWLFFTFNGGFRTEKYFAKCTIFNNCSDKILYCAIRLHDRVNLARSTLLDSAYKGSNIFIF